ncbi:two-component system sensor histidine kinase NtrB [Geoalkalibacter subterraneus]|uniref:two-component system sensor histidine kinase NtrB n=1 Tax=Geoalkalibacter subterraneus TaxID=483547 RepID=UPI000693F091|nr:ATP-binding protein [Geoalkalibacter subterraneus]
MDDAVLATGRPGPTRSQLSWFLFLRVVVISLFLGGMIVYQLSARLAVDHPTLDILFALVGLSYLQAIVSALLLTRVRRLTTFTQVQIVWDLLFVTALIYLSGGQDSIFSFLYILIIIGSAFLMARRDAFVVASAASILYGSLLDLQYFGYLPELGGLHFPAQGDGRQIFFALFVNVVAFFLTAFLAGTLSERLRLSQQALVRREIDYEELENLNRAILANIGSGLLMVNRQGRIRSFNAAGTRITGYRLEEVYDRDVRQVFPALDVFTGEIKPVTRGECLLTAKNGNRHTIGYDAAYLRDRSGAILGLLVTFQDLSHVKEMEARLQRADRLAAVGRLASGMAHEIRNPLASISGSVQLLMETEGLSEPDRRLMSIVVREADRLSGLLTDFLHYARPGNPLKEKVDVAQLFDELADLLMADERFCDIEIDGQYPRPCFFELDVKQMRQVLWNLSVNASEAMERHGRLTFLADSEKSLIAIEDTGPGIPQDIRQKIFDPFFTTKDSGTGLGLATVHAVVESHGGEVLALEGKAGGARFEIHLPQRTGHEAKL